MEKIKSYDFTFKKHANDVIPMLSEYKKGGVSFARKPSMECV
ncbi:hypothetical protein HBHAL_3557 [Halobacillus halophilus DSM 2266]|uniref:Uncharacterized protein n=1 Tax=Halobacillus halophilus (strain ATCC 35676 / DSM 2266 / JCM 20832 / KCTC 3685 / LMG 17431 / NBRC 102448 / NCIMB 2269) TaxID=866895 RepID=I0JP33_HALH3|nr:hypothetical protein HBHAL_3557 [Halobacillus halophilus DSM 2266]